ncbi:hypothetical protein BH10PSE19_BH10PSE19_19550 [soil metagenome]
MKLLMCSPDFYDVVYEINPWMNRSLNIAHTLAKAQWQHLTQTLKACGADIELVTAIPGWPDMVFTANAGLLYNKKMVLAHFRYKERQGETPYFKEWFNNAGFTVIADSTVEPQLPYFEGAGDALLAGDKLFAAYGFRSERRFYTDTTYFDQNKLVLCELIDPYFYHLDTCFCPLNEHQAIWYPAAFSPASQISMTAQLELFAVEEDEAKRFACTAVVLDTQVVMAANCPKTAALLQGLGFTTHGCDMSEYIKAGGSCKCLTLQLD